MCLCVCSELLSGLQSELKDFPDSVAVIFSEPVRNVVLPSEIISSSFEGQLLSEVICHTCNTVSDMLEPFYDLSLDFPPRWRDNTLQYFSTIVSFN